MLVKVGYLDGWLRMLVKVGYFDGWLSLEKGNA